ncbi:hypothetical protein WJX72_005975 [[Myrmecia] bisecta]|uniref:non-specific serine/threonine protein kinase n=1 Tax=[Myrmecia] bisecta TaxID=41462 RepID=A0AAW1PG93_9CHLO
MAGLSTRQTEVSAAVVRELNDLQSGLLSEKATTRKDAVKKLSAALDSQDVLQALDLQTLRLRAKGKVAVASWPGLVTVLISCVQKELASAKTRGPDAGLARTFRKYVQSAEDDRRSGHKSLLLRRAGKLFSHVKETLERTSLASPFGTEYSTMLRNHLLAYTPYCQSATSTVFQELLHLFMTKLEAQALNRSEETFRAASSLQLLVQRFPADMEPDFQQDMLLFFRHMFPQLHSLREDSRLSLSLLTALNSFLLTNGLDVSSKAGTLHDALHPYVVRAWRHAREPKLKEGLLTYLRLQLRLQALQGLPGVTELRDVLEQDLLMPAFSWGEARKGGLLQLGKQQQALLSVLASLHFYGAQQVASTMADLDEDVLPTKRARRSSPLAGLLEQALEAPASSGTALPDWKIVGEALEQMVSLAAPCAVVHQETMLALAVLAERRLAKSSQRTNRLWALPALVQHGISEPVLQLLAAVLPSESSGGTQEAGMRHNVLELVLSSGLPDLAPGLASKTVLALLNIPDTAQPLDQPGVRWWPEDAEAAALQAQLRHLTRGREYAAMRVPPDPVQTSGGLEEGGGQASLAAMIRLRETAAARLADLVRDGLDACHGENTARLPQLLCVTSIGFRCAANIQAAVQHLHASIDDAWAPEGVLAGVLLEAVGRVSQLVAASCRSQVGLSALHLDLLQQLAEALASYTAVSQDHRLAMLVSKWAGELEHAFLEAARLSASSLNAVQQAQGNDAAGPQQMFDDDLDVQAPVASSSGRPAAGVATAAAHASQLRQQSVQLLRCLGSCSGALSTAVAALDAQTGLLARRRFHNPTLLLVLGEVERLAQQLRLLGPAGLRAHQDGFEGLIAVVEASMGLISTVDSRSDSERRSQWQVRVGLARALVALFDLDMQPFLEDPAFRDDCTARVVHLLQDVSYFARREVGEIIPCLYTKWTNVQGQFDEFVQRLSLRNLQNTGQDLSNEHMETGVLMLGESAAACQEVEGRALYLLCSHAACAPSQHACVEAVLEALARRLNYPSRHAYVAYHLTGFIYMWFSNAHTLDQLLDIQALVALDGGAAYGSPTSFFSQAYLRVLVPVMLLDQRADDLQKLSELRGETVSQLLRRVVDSIFGTVLPYVTTGNSEDKKMATSVLQKGIMDKHLPAAQRDAAFAANIVGVLGQMLLLASSQEAPAKPYFPLATIVKSICNVPGRQDAAANVEIIWNKVLCGDGVARLLLLVHEALQRARHPRHQSQALAALQALLLLLGPRVRAAATATYATHILLQLMRSRELQELCCQLLGDIVDQLVKEPDARATLGALLPALVSAAAEGVEAQEATAGHDAGHPCVKLILRLTTQAPAGLQPFLRQVDTLPAVPALAAARELLDSSSAPGPSPPARLQQVAPADQMCPTLHFCMHMAKRKAAFAELLLPYILADLAANDCNGSLGALISQQVSCHLLASSPPAPLQALRLLLSCLNSLRSCRLDAALGLARHSLHRLERPLKAGRGTHASQNGNAPGESPAFWPKAYWLDVDYLAVAAAALRCSACFTALLYAEHWCEEEHGRLALGEERTLNEASLPMADQLLLDIYGQIDEPDGIYALARSHVIASQLRLYQHEGAWSKVLAGYDMLLRQASARAPPAPRASQRAPAQPQQAAQAGLVAALQQLGCSHLLQAYVTSASTAAGPGSSALAEVQAESAWRLGQWDGAAEVPAAPVEPTLASNAICAGLKALEDGDRELCQSVLFGGRAQIVRALAASSTESAKAINPACVRLQLLEGLREAWALRWPARPLTLTPTTPTPPADGDWQAKVPSRHELQAVEDAWQARQAAAGGRYELLEPLLSMRRVVMAALQAEEGQVASLLQLARAARKAGQLAHSMAAIHQLRTLRQAAPAQAGVGGEEWQVEEAKLLWAGGQAAMAVRMAKALLQLIDSEQPPGSSTPPRHHLHAHLLCLTAKWLAASRSESSSSILQMMMRAAGAGPGGAGAPGLACRTSFRLAHYADTLYRGIQDHKRSPEWNTSQAVIRHKKQQVILLQARLEQREVRGEVKRNAGGEVTDRESRQLMSHINQLQRPISFDEEENAVLQANEGRFLLIALANYRRCLAASNAYDNAVVFRLCQLWFALGTNAEVNKALALSFQQIPSYKFLPLVYQIASRMSAAKTGQLVESGFQGTVAALLERLAREHPYHTLYQLYALKNGNRGRDGQVTGQQGNVGGGMAHSADMDKVAAARAILDRLAADPTRGQLVDQVSQLIEAYISLAALVTAPEVTEMAFPTKLRRQLKSLALVPLPSVSLPVDPAATYTDFAHFNGFGDKIQFVGGINRPKLVVCLDNLGGRHRQLVKSGNDDMRQDAVMQQFFGLINNVLQDCTATRKRKLHIVTYKVVPFSPASGLLEWVEETMPLSEYLTGADRVTGAHKRYGKPDDINFVQCFQSMQKAQRSMLPPCFDEVCRRFTPCLHHFFLEFFREPATWFERRLAYTRSVAVNSMAGYIIGLGDRHAHNILIDKSSASVVHIDLGVAFEQGRFLNTPELVPFRLTRDVVDGMGATGVEGVMRRCCEETLRVLRANKESLLTIIEVFIHDPLYKWALTPMGAQQRQKDSLGGEEGGGGEGLEVASSPAGEAGTTLANADAERALLRVKQKLDGLEGGEGEGRGVEGQVQQLLHDAQDPDKLCRMYVGWAAWM